MVSTKNAFLISTNKLQYQIYIKKINWKWVYIYWVTNSNQHIKLRVLLEERSYDEQVFRTTNVMINKYYITPSKVSTPQLASAATKLSPGIQNY